MGGIVCLRITTRAPSAMIGSIDFPSTRNTYSSLPRGRFEMCIRDREERARWKNFAVHPDLLKEANDAVMVEMGLKSREDVDREKGVLPLEEQEDSSEGDLLDVYKRQAWTSGPGGKTSFPY